MTAYIILSGLTAGVPVLFAFALGASWQYHRQNTWWWNEMIRRRHAEYHWENGKIYWNEDLPKTLRDPAAEKVRGAIREASLTPPPQSAVQKRA